MARTNHAQRPGAVQAYAPTGQSVGQVSGAGVVEFGPVVNSILVADCGSSFTRVSLLERVEGGYSFVAHGMTPTTVEPPWSDVSIGVRQAIEQITASSKRSLLDQNGSLTVPEMGGKGVDLFVVTGSVGQPLRVILAGLVSQVSLASLERAASSAYVDVLGLIARDYIGSPGKQRPVDVPISGDTTAHPGTPESEPVGLDGSLSDEDKIAFIRHHHPDLVWVAGGTDGGSRVPVRDLVETVALACTLVDGSPQPAIVYAGNADLRTEIVELIGDEVELEIIDNVRPTLDKENLTTARTALQSAYVQRKIQTLPGIGDLTGWSGAPVLSTAQALEYLVMYLAHLYESGKGVLCADVGSANVIIAACFPTRHGVPRHDLPRSSLVRALDGGQHTLHVAPNLGVGYGAPTLLEQVSAGAIARWLPFEPEPGEVEGVLLSKGIRTTTIPTDQRQLLIEQAAAREALRLLMGQARANWYTGTTDSRRWLTPLLEPIIASGAVLARAPRPSQSVLMLLDTIEPIGITTIVLDEHGVASALGAVAVTQPLAATQALDGGAFLNLATVIAPIGRARPGEVVLRVKITFEQGGEMQLEAKQGSIEVLPLRIGQRARMELKPRRGIYAGRTGKSMEVSGSVVGLVIDARGRPLRLPSNAEACRQSMQQWQWEMGA